MAPLIEDQYRDVTGNEMNEIEVLGRDSIGNLTKSALATVMFSRYLNKSKYRSNDSSSIARMRDELVGRKKTAGKKSAKKQRKKKRNNSNRKIAKENSKKQTITTQREREYIRSKTTSNPFNAEASMGDI